MTNSLLLAIQSNAQFSNRMLSWYNSSWQWISCGNVEKLFMMFLLSFCLYHTSQRITIPSCLIIRASPLLEEQLQPPSTADPLMQQLRLDWVDETYFTGQSLPMTSPHYHCMQGKVTQREAKFQIFTFLGVCWFTLMRIHDMSREAANLRIYELLGGGGGGSSAI